MHFAGTSQRLLASVGAFLGVLTLAGATVAWRVSDASAVTSPSVVAAAVTPETTTSTTAPTPTTVPPTSTSTTVKPVPTTTTIRATTTVPPVTAPPTTRPPTTAPPASAVAPAGGAERCAAARQWVSEHGLNLPAGWGFRCPGQALQNGTPRWGVACWNCAGDGVSYIAVDVGRIGASDAALRYVIAHETCHAIDYLGLAVTSEVGADLCAALHGAPRP